MSTSVATPPALAPKSSEVSFTFGGSRPESSETTLPYKGPYRIDTVCGGDCVMVCGVADWRGSEVDPSTCTTVAAVSGDVPVRQVLPRT